ncbi:hypothetical protein M0R45_017163 [Rubus argutus]|uniref:Uncharacterized protein n=1 Tax=Rubus argutus TaxID=59490 RepID=A0AAW1XVC3_RUBAR
MHLSLRSLRRRSQHNSPQRRITPVYITSAITDYSSANRHYSQNSYAFSAHLLGPPVRHRSITSPHRGQLNPPLSL